MEQKSLPKILYIDDTPDARMLVSRILSHDYVVLEAGDPIAGIELALDTRPDLVLVDVNLPQLSGHEVATRLRTLLPNTPLVAFTADISPGARERALAAGCDGYISKPLDIETFADQIGEFLLGKHEVIHGDSAQYIRAYQSELVERLEAKVRKLTETAAHNAYLNDQNARMVAALQRRQRLLEAGARVSRSITSILNLDELLQSTVDIICEEFRLRYAAIFLKDASGEWAILRADRGESGRPRPAEGRLSIGGDSMVGEAIRTRSARIRTPQAGAPGAQSEIALPLIVKDTALGALSVQSDRPRAFEEDDLTALQATADQIAIALKNAQLLRELADAQNELLRTKTFEAIATTTGEAIHWVGNRAAPIPDSARRVREDVSRTLAIVQALLAEPPETRERHAWWPVFQSILASAAEQDIDLVSITRDLAAIEPQRLQSLGLLESIDEDLRIIEQSARTILNIKEDLIGPARQHQPARLSLPDLLRDTLAGMGLPADVVRLETAPDLPPIVGDPRQLNQVFNNLIKNAWEALAGHPAPRIDVIIRLADDPQFIVVQVRDNGPGIPAELLDKIWVSFFTTKGARGGTGLGLTASAGIVGRHSGRIWLDSRPGEGATFSVLLPVAS